MRSRLVFLVVTATIVGFATSGVNAGRPTSCRFSPLNRPSRRSGAPVYLPDGAVVTQMKAYVYDYAADSDLEIWLYRMALATFEREDMAVVSTSGTSDVIQTLTTVAVVTWPIDNTAWAYYVEIGTGLDENWDVLLGPRAVVLTYTVDAVD